MDKKTDYFSDPIAEKYDENLADFFLDAAIHPVLNILQELTGNGRALELGVGTGRLAIPLVARGVPVHGIEFSTAMVNRMLAKPGGDKVAITIGDFASTRVEGTFSMAYLVFNTIMNLTTQSEQVACFHNVSNHLIKGGFFVIEVGVPSLRSLPPGQNIYPFSITEKSFGFDMYNTVTQEMTSNYFTDVEGKAETAIIPFRYVWPSELDLMAEMAGMRLKHRWADWNRELFTSESKKHISIWEKI